MENKGGILLSVCTFIAANCPLYEVSPIKEYPLDINIVNGTTYGGDADDNFFLHIFEDVRSYTDKEYGVYLEWAYYTEGRANQIINYIKETLRHTDTVEIWHVWLMDYYEYDERPVIKSCTIPIAELEADDIRELDNAEIWNNKDIDRPIFYCIKVV